jgi:REP element-mobilizing transposase RayT
MARPLRIEYPDAWYHVMNRGANHNFIFYNDKHKELFLSLLNEIVNMYSVEIHSYCLMGNHYHLLIRTPFPNLSKAMRHLNGLYTQKFNQLEGRDGALFRGRYKAILIQNELYLLQVSRYGHLNPVKAKICDLPEQYVWSSYQKYIGKSEISFVQTSFILKEIGGIENYIDFMQEQFDTELHEFYNQSPIPTVLGNYEFKNAILKNLPFKKMESSLADVKRVTFLPEICTISKIVINFYGTTIENIIEKKSIYRFTIIYLAKTLGQHSYPKIAKYFNTTPDAIRGIVRRYKNFFEIHKDINAIINILATSQT